MNSLSVSQKVLVTEDSLKVVKNMKIISLLFLVISIIPFFVGLIGIMINGDGKYIDKTKKKKVFLK